MPTTSPQQQWQNTWSQTKVLETKKKDYRVSISYAFRHELCSLQPKSNHIYKGAWDANNIPLMGNTHWGVKNVEKSNPPPLLKV